MLQVRVCIAPPSKEPYIKRMIRVLTSALWVFVTIAFGFDAVAQPCDLRAELQMSHADVSTEQMPCHEGMTMGADTETPDAPVHQKETCCCAALLTNAVTVNAVDLDQPLPSVQTWADPFPDSATSIAFEFEPPPPRA